MLRVICLAAALLAPVLPQAQPVSESMVDCAAHFENAAGWMSDATRSGRPAGASCVWHAAAVTEFAREGRTRTAEEVWADIDARTAAFAAKGRSYFLTREFRDRSASCRSFARHTGVTFRP